MLLLIRTFGIVGLAAGATLTGFEQGSGSRSSPSMKWYEGGTLHQSQRSNGRLPPEGTSLLQPQTS